MLDPTNRQGYSRTDAKFLEIIDRYGWHVMSVAPAVNSDQKEELFSYTTGLFFRFTQPEIIVIGLDSDTGTSVLNEIGHQMKKGRLFETGTGYHDIFANNVSCQFRPVHPSWYDEYVGFSTWFYETTDFPLWQCFWPDRHGIYPWEDRCNEGVAKQQPLLFKPFDPIVGSATTASVC